MTSAYENWTIPILNNDLDTELIKKKWFSRYMIVFLLWLCRIPHVAEREFKI